MEDMLQWGLNHLQTTRHNHMTQEVMIGFIKEEAVPLQATKSASKAQSTQNRVGLNTHHFDFMFRRSDLIANDIQIQRGLRIWDESNTYEIAFQGKLLWYYNDPAQLDVVIQTVKVDSTDYVVPNVPYPHNNQLPNTEA